MLDRRDFVRRLLIDRGDLLGVTGLGAATFDVAAAGDHPLNFYLWGAMGGAAMIGLGLALAKPERRVAVVTGDGEQLMGMGELATIGVRQPQNLTVVGIVSPICFAALRLTMNSNFCGCATGRSAGLAPFKILSTYSAARRDI